MGWFLWCLVTRTAVSRCTFFKMADNYSDSNTSNSDRLFVDQVKWKEPHIIIGLWQIKFWWKAMCEVLIVNTQKRYEKQKNFGNFLATFRHLSATFLGFIGNLWLSLPVSRVTFWVPRKAIWQGGVWCRGAKKQSTWPEKSLTREILTSEYPSVVEDNFAPSFSLKFLGIFVHISGSIDAITLIWVSRYSNLERLFSFCRTRPFRSLFRLCQMHNSGAHSSEFSNLVPCQFPTECEPIWREMGLETRLVNLID